MKRKLLAGVAIAAGSISLLAGTAGATHAHYLYTPGNCHEVAPGSTSRHHQYHDHVHGPVGKNGGPLDPNNAGPAPVSISLVPCP